MTKYKTTKHHRKTRWRLTKPQNTPENQMRHFWRHKKPDENHRKPDETFLAPQKTRWKPQKTRWKPQKTKWKPQKPYENHRKPDEKLDLCVDALSPGVEYYIVCMYRGNRWDKHRHGIHVFVVCLCHHWVYDSAEPEAMQLGGIGGSKIACMCVHFLMWKRAQKTHH